MSALQQNRGNSAMLRPVRPKLTVDTRAHTKPDVDQPATESAPVLACRESGIPHLSQAVDRNCKKVSEMMNSPTWRSQRPGPTVVDDSTPSEPHGLRHAYTPDSRRYYVEHDGEYHSVTEDEDSNEILYHFERQRARRRHADSGISLGRDPEAMSILGIHPFSEMPDSPASTFVIAAAVPNRVSHYFRNVMDGDLHLVIPHKRADIQSKAPQYGLSFELTSEDEYFGSHFKDFQSSSRSVSHGSGQARTEEALNKQDILGTARMKQNMDRDIHQLMDRDEAIKSVNSRQAPPRRDGRTDPEDKLRFQDLLGRLRCEAEALADDRTDKVALDGPAIVVFAPKKSTAPSANGERAAHLNAEEKVYPTKGRHHASSDSGYASPTTHLRPNDRTLPRSRRGTSGETESDPLVIQHSNADSKYSKPDHPSKSSTLNPAAKVFSFANACSNPLEKRGGPAPVHVPEHVFSSSFPQAQFGAGVQLQNLGYNTLPSLASPLTNFALTHTGLPQLPPALLPRCGPFTQATMIPPPGLSLPINMASGFPCPGTLPSLPILQPPPSVGLPGPANSSGLMPVSGPVPAGLVDPFHQQLPSVPSCNNPAHQTPPALNATEGFSATTPQLPPPAPPASLLNPIHRGPVPPAAPPVAPVVNPIFGKNVPKPKVPNTTGQQYWEYWHELRRTFEPGYAQKSKQNQQKRYMKQLGHKSDGTTNQP